MVEKVVVWKARGILFDTEEEEAVEYENGLAVRDAGIKQSTHRPGSPGHH